MYREVSSLHRVDERDPNQVTKRKHHSKAVGGDVHRRQNRRLEPPRVKNVHCLHDSNADDAISDKPKVAVLLSAPCTIEDDPAHHTGAQLTPFLQINLADKGNGHSRVELTADEPVIEQVAGVAACSKLAKLGVAGLDTEAADIDECSDSIRDADTSRENLQIILAYERPNGKLGPLGDGTGSQCSESSCVGVESCTGFYY